MNEVLTAALLDTCPRPFLVVEDSSHYYREATAVLEFFHGQLRAGDYVVVEDGVLSQLAGEHYRRYEHGPNRAVSDFLGRHGDDYEVDTELCDHYGHNATYNPNGWLRRTWPALHNPGPWPEASGLEQASGDVVGEVVEPEC